MTIITRIVSGEIDIKSRIDTCVQGGMCIYDKSALQIA